MFCLEVIRYLNAKAVAEYRKKKRKAMGKEKFRLYFVPGPNHDQGTDHDS